MNSREFIIPYFIASFAHSDSEYFKLLTISKRIFKDELIKKDRNGNPFNVLASILDIRICFRLSVRMSIDTFCRTFLYYPDLFIQMPELKFLLKRFQVYDLIVRGSFEYAKTLYLSNFRYILYLDEFSHINNHFNIIFNNSFSRNIIIENYYQMKEEFLLLIENIYLNLINKIKFIAFKKDLKFTNIDYCLPNEITKYNLLCCEFKVINIISKVMKYKESQSNNSLFLFGMEIEQCQMLVDNNAFNHILYDDNNKSKIDEGFGYNDHSIETRSSNCRSKYNGNRGYSDAQITDYYKNLSYMYNYEINLQEINEILGVNEPLISKFDADCLDYFNILSYFSIGTDYSIIRHTNKCKFNYNKKYNDFIFLFPSSVNKSLLFGFNSYSKRAFNIRNKVHFLKSFSPKFMKRESIDKIIIRRFRKFAISYLNSKGIIYMYANSKKDKKDWISEYRTSPFFYIINFAYSNYIPPFTYNNTVFKSYNTIFMVWLFSNSSIFYLYDLFSSEIGDNSFNKIINEYNLLKEEPCICDKLKYYITNYNKIYDISEKIEESKININDSINTNSYDDYQNIESRKYNSEINKANKVNIIAASNINRKEIASANITSKAIVNVNAYNNNVNDRSESIDYSKDIFNVNFDKYQYSDINNNDYDIYRKYKEDNDDYSINNIDKIICYNNNDSISNCIDYQVNSNISKNDKNNKLLNHNYLRNLDNNKIIYNNEIEHIQSIKIIPNIILD